jgi:hypothetical protein
MTIGAERKRSFGRAPNGPRSAVIGVERGLVITLFVTLLGAVAVAIAFHSGAGPSQSFAANGFAKRLLLPAMLLVLTAVAVYGWRIARPRVSPPLWWWLLVAALLISVLRVVVSDNTPSSVLGLAQSGALLGGALMLFVLGCVISEMSSRTATSLLLIASAATIGSLWLGTNSLVPFVGVAIPTIAALIYVGLRESRGIAVLAGIGLAVWTAVNLSTTRAEVSLALVAQIVVATAVLAAALLPRILRGLALVAGGVLTALQVLGNGYLKIFFGYYAVEDVTLAQRGYETRQVWEDLTSSGALDMLVGRGPASTVNLTWSPDAATLLAAGRDIASVDDTHLLTTWFLLKFGIIGIVVFALLLVTVGRLSLFALRQPRPVAADLVPLIYVLSGIAFAVPAATNLFVEPATFLALGVLWARFRAARKVLESGGAL